MGRGNDGFDAAQHISAANTSEWTVTVGNAWKAFGSQSNREEKETLAVRKRRAFSLEFKTYAREKVSSVQSKPDRLCSEPCS